MRFWDFVRIEIKFFRTVEPLRIKLMIEFHENGEKAALLLVHKNELISFNR